MDPHMLHHHRPSSALRFKFAAIKKEEENDIEEEEEEVEEEVEVEVEEEEQEEQEVRQLKKKRMNFVGGSRKRGSTTASHAGGGGGVALPSCRAEKCNADLTHSKRYHQRHKVCEYHAKAEVVMVEGLKQRFCQQCSRFHELSEFDETKRSCRRRLAGHNERRRKHFSESRGGSSPGIKKDQCRQIDERGRTPMVFPENHQNFHIH